MRSPSGPCRLPKSQKHELRSMSVEPKRRATYEQAQERIKKTHGWVAQSCRIAHVLSHHGMTTRQAPNRISRKVRKCPCPPEKWPVIEKCLRFFKRI